MKRLLLLLLPLVFGGCAVPAKAIRGSYAGFNETIQYNQSQQMLLNLVRMKYRETPLFLKVGALSASWDYQASALANLGRGTGSKNYGLTVGGSFSTRPTITYTPLEGNTFVRQVLMEIPPETFVLLYRSGWPMTTLCHVMVEKIQEDYNNKEQPSYDRFTAFVETLREAQKADDLRFVAEDGEILMVLKTDRKDPYGPERGSEKREFKVPFRDIYLRSFLDIMFFLGKNTEIPKAHLEQVKESEPNGWMHIKSSSSPPSNAMVWVEHQGYYFSIGNEDIQSKDTFALLKLLFQMQAGDVKGLEPILTIPVAQP